MNCLGNYSPEERAVLSAEPQTGMYRTVAAHEKNNSVAILAQASALQFQVWSDRERTRARRQETKIEIRAERSIS